MKRKIVSLLLAVMMLILCMPYCSVAAEGASSSYEQTLKEQYPNYDVIPGSVTMPTTNANYGNGTSVTVDGGKVTFAVSDTGATAFKALEFPLNKEANAERYVVRYKMKLNATDADDAYAINQLAFTGPIAIANYDSSGIRPTVTNAAGTEGTWASKGVMGDYINKELSVHCDVSMKARTASGGLTDEASTLIIDAGDEKKIDMTNSFYNGGPNANPNLMKVSFRKHDPSSAVSFEIYDIEVYSLVKPTALSVTGVTDGTSAVNDAAALKGKTATISYSLTNLSGTIIAAAYDSATNMLLNANYGSSASGSITLAVPETTADIEIYIYAWDGLDKMVPLVTQKNIFEN